MAGSQQEKKSCSRQTHLLRNLLILGQTHKHFHVLVSQLPDSQLVVLLGDVVGQDHSRKHREPIGSVQGAIVVVVVDPCELLRTRRWCISVYTVKTSPPFPL